MPSNAGNVHIIEDKLQKVANELRQIQDLLVTEEAVDPRVLSDFRDAVNKVRAVTWAVEQYAKVAASQQLTARVLVADDSRFQVELLTMFLSKQGLIVKSASDGLQAWTAALREQPDVIILDLNMPAGSGIDVLKKLKMSNRTSAIPVIGITASTDAAAQQNMTAVGANAFLPKPLDLDRLYAVIVDLVGTRAKTASQTS